MTSLCFQFIDDIKISSVVCDERYDNAVVRIDKNGFHPAVYYIQKSQSVMWVWKGGEDEAHNVIHVKSPDSDVSWPYWNFFLHLYQSIR